MHGASILKPEPEAHTKSDAHTKEAHTGSEEPSHSVFRRVLLDCAMEVRPLICASSRSGGQFELEAPMADAQSLIYTFASALVSHASDGIGGSGAGAGGSLDSYNSGLSSHMLDTVCADLFEEIRQLLSSIKTGAGKPL